MKNLIVIFFFVLSLSVFAGDHIVKLPKVSNPAITISSADKTKVYHQENTATIPWESYGIDWSHINDEDVVMRLYDFSTGEGAEIKFTGNYLKEGVVLSFSGGTPTKHFASFPEVMVGDVTLYDPDTMETVYQTKVKSGVWEIAPYTLDNYKKNYILIDITNGFFLHEDLYKVSTDKDHLYALVKTESLLKGSVTVSLPTNIAYRSLKDKKEYLTKDDYYQLYHRNSRKLVASGMKYTFSDSEDALYLRAPGVMVSNMEYDFLPKELSLKQYKEKTSSLFDTVSGLSEQQIHDIYSLRFVELDGWSNHMPNSTTALYWVDVNSFKDVEEVFINGEKVNIYFDGNINNQYEPTPKSENESVVIEIKVPEGYTVSWHDCKKIENGACHPKSGRNVRISATIVSKEGNMLKQGENFILLDDGSIKSTQESVSVEQGESIFSWIKRFFGWGGDKEKFPETNLEMWEKYKPGEMYKPNEIVDMGDGYFFLTSEKQGSKDIKVVEVLKSDGLGCAGVTLNILVLGVDKMVCDVDQYAIIKNTRLEHITGSLYLAMLTYTQQGRVDDKEVAAYTPYSAGIKFFGLIAEASVGTKGSLVVNGEFDVKDTFGKRLVYEKKEDGSYVVTDKFPLLENEKKPYLKNSEGGAGIKNVYGTTEESEFGIYSRFGVGFTTPIPLNATFNFDNSISIVSKYTNLEFRKDCVNPKDKLWLARLYGRTYHQSEIMVGKFSTPEKVVYDKRFVIGENPDDKCGSVDIAFEQDGDFNVVNIGSNEYKQYEFFNSSAEEFVVRATISDDEGSRPFSISKKDSVEKIIPPYGSAKFSVEYKGSGTLGIPSGIFNFSSALGKGEHRSVLNIDVQKKKDLFGSDVSGGGRTYEFELYASKAGYDYERGFRVYGPELDIEQATYNSARIRLTEDFDTKLYPYNRSHDGSDYGTSYEDYNFYSVVMIKEFDDDRQHTGWGFDVYAHDGKEFDVKTHDRGVLFNHRLFRIPHYVSVTKDGLLQSDVVQEMAEITNGTVFPLGWERPPRVSVGATAYTD